MAEASVVPQASIPQQKFFITPPLTDRRIEKLKATGATYVVGDAGCPGLRLRLNPDGSVRSFVWHVPPRRIAPAGATSRWVAGRPFPNPGSSPWTRPVWNWPR
jgi:hypothetical protein